MVRSVVAEESILPYLKGLTCQESYEIGLIIGQTTSQRDYVIHLARTPRTSQQKDDISDSSKVDRYVTIRALKDVDETCVADHAKHVTRMLPGGMFVLGIFVVGPGDIFAEASSLSRLRTVLARIKKIVLNNKFLHGNSPNPEKLVLHLCSTTQRFVCKILNPDNIISTPIPIDWKFQSSPTKWHQVDCQFELDQTFPITTEKVAQPLKKNLQEILEAVEEQVQAAVCMLDGETRELSDAIESLGKKKKGKSSKANAEEGKLISASMYMPCEKLMDNVSELQIIDCCGKMKFRGVLASRAFLHQKATVEEAVQALKEDIMRSFASRLEMHWDSVIEEEHGSPEENVTLHEPPRRVLVSLPHCRVTLSDYLFPGEGANEALISLEELLDLQMKESDVQKELELQADPSEYTNEMQLERESGENLLPGPVTSSMFFITVLLIGFAVLVISVVVQFSGWTNR